jgi:hypothetical protein
VAAKMEKTSVPGVYRRGSRYVFTYRYRSRQHWRSAATLAEARRLKHELEADVARGEHRELGRLTFGDYAREWIELYQGRTSRGFRESTPPGLPAGPRGSGDSILRSRASVATCGDRASRCQVLRHVAV